jgi:hypothetical protein
MAIPKTTEGRRFADLYRRVASIPTSGGHRADLILRPLADKLDREAAAPENRGTSVGGKAASSPSLPVLFVPEVHRRSVWKRNN